MDIMTPINKNGRIVVPARLRKALGLQAGDVVLLRLEGGSIRILPLRQAVGLAQKNVQRYVPKGVSLVDELMRARGEEADYE